jgi:hypothetical protein
MNLVACSFSMMRLYSIYLTRHSREDQRRSVPFCCWFSSTKRRFSVIFTVSREQLIQRLLARMPAPSRRQLQSTK